MSTSSFPAVVDGPDWEGRRADVFVGPEPLRHGPRAESGYATLTRSRRHGALRRVALFALAGDVVGVVLASLLVTTVEPWAGPATAPTDRYRFLLVACPVVSAVLVVHAARAGVRHRLTPRVADDLGSLLAALLASGVVLLAISSVASLDSWTPPGEVGLALGTMAAVVPITRRAALSLASLDADNVVRVVVVGAGSLSDELCTRLDRSPLVTVVGVVDDPTGDGRTLLGRIEDLPRLCAAGEVDRLVVAFAGRHPGRCATVLQDLRGVVDIDVVVRYYELANWESRLSDVTGLTLVSVGRAAGPVAAAAKRALDVTVAALSLVVLSPILALVALAVRVESGGPVLFRQVRVGRHRRPFHIVKFRTMRAAPEGARPLRARTPLDNPPDPSLVTPLGGLLRRAGLDELPQLVNVLRGEMSLVGPRPFIPDECVGLGGAVERRFDVRPGMTGMWQVCGQHTVGLEELCRLDVQYATSWSLRGDLRILARTPARLLRGSAEGR